MIKFLIAGSIVLSAIAGAQATERVRLQLAQSDMCPVAIQNAETCLRNWRNIGGGSSGQAGSFRQCAQIYCQAITTANCRPKPSGCSEVGE